MTYEWYEVVAMCFSFFVSGFAVGLLVESIRTRRLFQKRMICKMSPKILDEIRDRIDNDEIVE